MHNRIPDEIIKRKKVGFPTPLAAMFRCDLSDYLRETLLSSRALRRGYFDKSSIERLIEEHLELKSDHHKILWQLIVLEEWHRAFIDPATSVTQ